MMYDVIMKTYKPLRLCLFFAALREIFQKN